MTAQHAVAPQAPVRKPAPPMTPWTSVPQPIRFAVWVWAILTIISAVVVPVSFVLGFGTLLAAFGAGA